MMPASSSCGRRWARRARDMSGAPRWRSAERRLPHKSSRSTSGVHRSATISVALATDRTARTPSSSFEGNESPGAPKVHFWASQLRRPPCERPPGHCSKRRDGWPHAEYLRHSRPGQSCGLCGGGSHWSITSETGRAQPHKGERSKKQGDRDMAKCHAPSQHARTTKEIERRAECQRTEEPARVAERRVDGQRRATLAGLGAAGAPRGQRRRVGPDQHRVQQDESARARVWERRTEADDRRQCGGGEHRAEDEAPATESNGEFVAPHACPDAEKAHHARYGGGR